MLLKSSAISHALAPILPPKVTLIWNRLCFSNLILNLYSLQLIFILSFYYRVNSVTNCWKNYLQILFLLYNLMFDFYLTSVLLFYYNFLYIFIDHNFFFDVNILKLYYWQNILVLNFYFSLTKTNNLMFVFMIVMT